MLRLTESTLLPDRVGKEPEPPVGAPATRAELSADAQTEWDRLVKELVRTPELLTTNDGEALCLLASCRARLTRLYKWLEEDPERCVTEGAKGNLVTHPKQTQYEKEREHMLRLLIQFGLTPAARARVVVSNPKGKDKKERFWSA